MLYLFEYAKETIHILSSQSVKGEQQNLFITYRRGRKCFQKRQSVILSNGGRSDSRGVCLQGSLHPGRSPSKGVDRPPPYLPRRGGVGQTPLCLRPGVCPTLLVVTFSDGHCSGRYGSYRNAFLLTQCGLTVNGLDWHILSNNDKRIVLHYLTLCRIH